MVTLAGFVGGGLKAGESTIVIATTEHLKSLEQRLEASAVDDGCGPIVGSTYCAARLVGEGQRLRCAARQVGVREAESGPG